MKDDRRTSMRVRFGTSALTSLMTLGLELASNDSSFTLKIVFSFGLAAAASSPAAAASSAPAPAPPAAGAAAAAGKAISWMFRRVYNNFHILRKRCWIRGGDSLLTLRRVTRSAAWSSVRVDMSSTILCKAGSEGELGAVESGGHGGGGDDADVDDDAPVVAVASARARTNGNVLLLCAETLCSWIENSVSVSERTTLGKNNGETSPLTSRGHAQSNKR